MLGAAHSAANPLTARFGIVHGHAVGLMLPHVVRFNSLDTPAARIYAELSWAAHLATPSEATEAAAGRLADRLGLLLNRARLPATLKDCGVQEKDLPQLASEAANQWTAQFNPRPVTTEDFQKLFELAL